jgi:protein O-mannosyl-transferase
VNFERIEPVLCLLDDRPFHRCRPSRLAWGAAGLLLLVVAVYGWAAWTGGLFWQDRATLQQVTSVFSLAHLWTHASGAYQPLSMTLLWLERRAFGRSPLPYHCISAALHAASAILLWLILRRLNVRGAWLAAALFAVLPAQVQSVAWITQQPHLVCAVWVLLAVWLYLRWMRVRPPMPAELANLEPDEPPGRGGYVLALAAGAAAMLSGPAGMALPVILLLLLAWKRGVPSRAEWRRLTPFFGLALAGLLAAVFLHHASTDPFAIIAPAPSALQRAGIAARAVGTYALDLLRPYPPQLIHPRWDPAWSAWNATAALLLAALGILAWAGRRRWGAGPVLSLLLFIALVLPGIVTALAQTAPAVYVAGPNAYLASAVPLALLAGGLMWVVARVSASAILSARAARVVVAIVAVALLGTFTVLQGLAYRDAGTAFKAALAHDPGNVAARAQYAMYLVNEDPDRAMKVLDEAGPASAAPAAADLTLMAARARVNLALGRTDEAIAGYLLAQRVAPEHPAVRLALAAAYDAGGARAMAEGRRDDAFENYQGALAAYDAARRLTPAEDESILDGVGRVLLHEGRIDDSLAKFDAAIALNPAFVAAHVHKAEALFDAALQGDGRDKMDRANAEIREALRIEPGNLEAYSAAANMRLRVRNFAAAEAYLRLAAQAAPNAVRVWRNLALAQSAQQHYQDAARSFERVAALNPESAQALTELGFAQLEQKQFNEASRSFERALALQADAPDALRGRAQVQLAMRNHKS